MKRFFAFLLCLLLLLPSALAEYPCFDIPPAVAGFYDRKVTISYFRNRTSPDGELAVLDAQGNQLAAIPISAEQKSGAIAFSADSSFPPCQTLRVVFRANGEETLQRECLLALDEPERPGVYKVNTKEKKIAITFDTANGPGKTEALLKLLDRYHARCTFFIQGNFAFNHPELVSLIAEKGHEIASHSLNHADMRELEDEQIYYQLTQANEVIEAASGKPVYLYRPPSGYFSYRDRAIAHALGMEMILWTFDSLDGFSQRPQERVSQVMTEKSEPGAIILMHVYGHYTLPVLEEYLPRMEEQGYEFVTVTDLMQCAEEEENAV